MGTLPLKIKKLHSDALIPVYGSAGAACFDLHSIEDGKLGGYLKNPSAVFGTGLAFEIPEGFAMMIYSRSSSGFNMDVRLSNCVGVIDADYRGEVKVKLIQDVLSHSPVVISKGDRIAQAMLVPVQKVELIETSEISETERGEKGFGSTGK